MDPPGIPPGGKSSGKSSAQSPKALFRADQRVVTFDAKECAEKGLKRASNDRHTSGGYV